MLELIARVLVPLATFVVGALFQSYRTQHSETAAQLNDLIKEIESVRDLATDYWMKDESDEAALLAIKVRSGLHLINLLAEPSLFSRPDVADTLLDELFDLSTGGEFETAARKRDPERAFDVRMAAASAIAAMRQRRRTVNAWSFPLTETFRAFQKQGQRFTPYKLGRVSRRILGALTKGR